MFKVFLLSLIHIYVGKIHIWSPPSVAASYRTKVIEYTIADMGDVPYGKSLIGKVVQASPFDLCTSKDGFTLDKKEDESIILLV